LFGSYGVEGTHFTCATFNFYFYVFELFLIGKITKTAKTSLLAAHPSNLQ
jgi:hypothetical protein